MEQLRHEEEDAEHAANEANEKSADQIKAAEDALAEKEKEIEERKAERRGHLPAKRSEAFEAAEAKLMEDREAEIAAEAAFIADRKKELEADGVAPSQAGTQARMEAATRREAKWEEEVKQRELQQQEAIVVREKVPAPPIATGNLTGSLIRNLLERN